MATNPYFNFYNQTNEQSLTDDLIVESIRQYGHDVIYLPRDITLEDKILNEPVINTFSKALDIEMYIKSWDSFQGQGQFLEKFGLEIRDRINLVVTKKSFYKFIQPDTNKDRPMEGDCIYVPMLKATYQINYVDSSANFYVLGKNYSWELDCELLEFSNEQFKTGNQIIDNLNKPFEHYDNPDYNLKNYDNLSQNQEIQDESDQIIDWSEKNPFGEV